jgi:catechol 2,3-dioxygenase-like lactoylglutathione lyase family enzyme
MAVTAVHHVTLRVQDPEATRSFFGSLGFDTMDIPAPPHVTRTWRGAPESGGFIALPVGSTFLVIAPPLDGAAADDRFDERRIGVDHLAIGVDSRADLEELVERLAALGVPTAGIELDPVLGHEYVCFRDPDNVQWEFYQD